MARLQPGAPKHLKFAVAIAVMAVVLVAAPHLRARAAGAASANDVARFLAGLRPSQASPLAAPASQPGWRRHAGTIDGAWAGFEKRQVTRVRVWSAARLRTPRKTMFYMFGGPDFVHANAFYPHATTYVLSGLEPVGPRPRPSALAPDVLAASMASLRRSLGHFLEFGYFITKDMGAQFRAGKFTGTLPVLYVFLVRSGKRIHAVDYVTLGRNGTVAPARGKRKPAGVRITFSGRDGVRRTLYYFSTNLENAGVAKSGFLKFCAGLGEGDSLVKSASYLLHLGNFTKVREFLLTRSATIIQDDSGIPLKYFTPGNWRLTPFGRYVGPIPVFKRHYQADLDRLFASGRARAVNFGIGYRWYYQHTNILLAERARGR